MTSKNKNLTRNESAKLLLLEKKLMDIARQKIRLEQEMLDHIGEIGKEKIDNFNAVFSESPINVIWVSENECMDDGYFSSLIS